MGKNTYNTYIKRVTSNVWPSMSPKIAISADATNMINDLDSWIFHQLATTAGELHRFYDQKTIDARGIQSAVRMDFPDTLAKHAISEGVKAVMNYESGKGGTRTKPTTKSARAKVFFPVGTIGSQLRKATNLRVGAHTPVYLAGVLDYITAELVESAGIAAKNENMTTIMPRHVLQGIESDEELNELFGNLASLRRK